MEKKFAFSDQPLTAKIIYGVVIAILCVSAIVVGIVAANSRKTPLPDATPPVTQPEAPPQSDAPATPVDPPADPVPEVPKGPTLIAPTVGKIVTEHSLSVPVFSDTLKEWRVHAGVDISTEEGANVYAASDGTVSAIYTDPLYGMTVEITHSADVKTVYSNLSTTLPASLVVGKNVLSGEKIGTVGDTALGELAQEPHLHFALRIKNAHVNPLDYITEESKKASLGIENTVS